MLNKKFDWQQIWHRAGAHILAFKPAAAAGRSEIGQIGQTPKVQSQASMQKVPEGLLK